MNGEVKLKHASKEGSYITQEGRINGYNYWIKSTGQNAIWFDVQNGLWQIGSVKKLGSNVCALRGPYYNSDGSAQTFPIWRFVSDNKWKETEINDVILEEI